MKLRHWKTRWKFLLALVLLVGAYFAYSTISHLYYEHQLAAYLAELDAREPGWSWEDRFARLPQLKPEDNAAMELRAIMRLLTLDEQRMALGVNEWSKGFYLHDNSNIAQANRDFLADHPNALLPQLNREALTSILTGSPCPEALQRVRNLKRFQDGLFEHKYRPILSMSLLPDVQCIRNLGILLSWSAASNLEMNKPEAAATDISSILDVVRVYDHDPFFISCLARTAIVQKACHATHRLLAQTLAPSTQMLKQLQLDFQAEEQRVISLPEVLRWERAILDHDLKLLHSGEYTLRKYLETRLSQFGGIHTVTGWNWFDANFVEWFPQAILGTWGQPKDYACERLEYLRFMDRMLSIAAKPEHCWVEEITRSINQATGVTPFVFKLQSSESDYQEYRRRSHLFLPQIAKAILIHRARCRCIAAALAAERYRLAKGSWLTSWEQLSPDFMASVPLDPFTGKPLILKPLSDGLMIYSVGWNGTDENGAIFPVDRQIYGDIGYRLWNPSERRKEMSKEIEENLKK
ncbi:MAG: hypothetical protein U0796_22005 [Gemmatales bacterium]